MRILAVINDCAKRRLLGWQLAGEPGLEMTFADDAASGVKLLRPGAFDPLVSDMFAERVDDHVSAERLADVAVRCDMPVIWLAVSGDV